MPNFLDNLTQYFRGGNLPIVRQGTGYTVDDYSGPTNSPSPSKFMDLYNKVVPPKVYSGTGGGATQEYEEPVQQRRPVGEAIGSMIGNMFQGQTFSGQGPGQSPDFPQVLNDNLPLQPEYPQQGSIMGYNSYVKPDNPYAEWSNEQLRSDIDPEVLNYLENDLLPISRSYGIPDYLTAAQWALESGRNVQDNPFGLMRNGELLDYGTPEDNIRAYDETLRDIMSTNLGIPYDEFDYANYSPEQLLRALQFDMEGNPSSKRYEAHMEDPQNYIDLLNNMPETRYYLSL